TVRPSPSVPVAVAASGAPGEDNGGGGADSALSRRVLSSVTRSRALVAARSVGAALPTWSVMLRWTSPTRFHTAVLAAANADTSEVVRSAGVVIRTRRLRARSAVSSWKLIAAFLVRRGRSATPG